MFHITENVAVGLNKGFNLNRNFILCAEDNPDGRYPDIGKSNSLQEYIEKDADGDIENLFSHLYQAGESTAEGAALFVNHEEFAYVLSVYLKSVLKEPVVDTAYIIYKLYIEGQQLSPFSMSGSFAEYLDVLKEYSPFTLDRFREEWEKAEPVKFFDDMLRESAPVQMLLPECIIDPKSKYAPFFFTKYEERRWEEWIDILQDLAGEILGAAPALGRIFKQVKINEHAPILEQLKRHTKTKWIIDYYDNDWNVKYCKSQFDPDFFKELFNDTYGHYASKETGQEKIIDLLSVPVWKAFRDDISSGFKSDFLMNSDDALFFSYIYRLKLEGRMDTIQKFRLKDGNI